MISLKQRSCLNCFYICEQRDPLLFSLIDMYFINKYFKIEIFYSLKKGTTGSMEFLAHGQPCSLCLAFRADSMVQDVFCGSLRVFRVTTFPGASVHSKMQSSISSGDHMNVGLLKFVLHSNF